MPGKVTAWLNNYKGYELVLDLHYNAEEISFEHVSYKKLNCKRSCKAEQKYYDKWLNTISNGSISEKTKLARNIIDIEYFEENTLNAIEQDVKNSNDRKPPRGDKVQQLAFYCKALAYSKKKQYQPLLKEVQDNTSSKKLKRYIEVYFEHINS